MKKYLMILAIAAFATAAVGCSKCAPKDVEELKEVVSGGGEAKSVAVEEIGKTLAPAICEKYGACNQNPDFNKDQCFQEISTGIAENLKAATDLKVTGEILEACKKSIADAPCEALNSATPPTGCEFLQ